MAGDTTSRRCWRVVTALGALSLVASACSSGASDRSAAPRPQPKVRVVVVAGGVHRTVHVRQGAHVAGVLHRAGIAPRDGRLRSIVEHRVLDAHATPATIELDGVEADRDTVVARPATLRVTDGVDTVEDVEAREEVVPPPGMPDALQYVHTSGLPGRSLVTRGKVSGEVFQTVVRVAPEPALRVGRKAISLSFDDGPSPTWTPQVLRILKAKKVPAVFCVVGTEVAKHPELVRAERKAGHKVCNHTLDHDEHLDTAPADRLEHEIGAGAQAIVDAGLPRSGYYRPPGGAISPAVYRAAAKHHEQLLFWATDPEDWRRPSPEDLARRVVLSAKPGAIVLLHDGGGDRSATIAALPLIIDFLRAQGYTFTLPILPTKPRA